MLEKVFGITRLEAIIPKRMSRYEIDALEGLRRVSQPIGIDIQPAGKKVLPTCVMNASQAAGITQPYVSRASARVAAIKNRSLRRILYLFTSGTRRPIARTSRFNCILHP